MSLLFVLFNVFTVISQILLFPKDHLIYFQKYLKVLHFPIVDTSKALWKIMRQRQLFHFSQGYKGWGWKGDLQAINIYKTSFKWRKSWKSVIWAHPKACKSRNQVSGSQKLLHRKIAWILDYKNLDGKMVPQTNYIKMLQVETRHL